MCSKTSALGVKKYLTLGLITSIFLISSCSIDWKDENKTKVESLEKQVLEMKKEKENDLFKKKQECGKYKANIEKEIESEIKSGAVYFKFSPELFYSQGQNSCFAIFEEKSITGKEYWIIKDILTGNVTNYQKFEDGPLFYKKIKELKGE